MATPHDFYAELGVYRDATDDVIRSAYRKLARQHHPDVNPGKPEAEERFKRVASAYEVLSNKEKRARYDEFGEASLQSGFNAEQARAHQRQQEGPRARDVPFDFDLTDLIDRERRSRRVNFPIEGEDIVAEAELDFVSALNGAELEIDVPTRSTCDVCVGSGADPNSTPSTCTECGGSGRVQVVHGPMRMTSACSTCGGDGKVRTPCAHCHGAGMIDGSTRTRVRIPKGADDGSELRVRGKGSPGLYGGAPGDLVIRTRVTPHTHFTRDGLDLRLTLPITLVEAHLGGAVPVPTPAGVVQLKIPPHTQNGAQLRLRGKGVSRGADSGDLYVTLSVQLPKDDSPELVEALQAASRFYPDDVRKEVRL